MAKKNIVTPQAQRDLDSAYNWCQRQSQGLGKDFVRCVDACLGNVFRYPLHHQAIFENVVRRALVSRFPYSIYFVNKEDSITVFAILDQRRSPEIWQERINK